MEEEQIHFLSDVIVAVSLPCKDEPLKDVFTADSDYCGLAQGAGSIFPPKQPHRSIRHNTDPVSHATSKCPIAHFTVIGGNEAGVDLALVQPFLLYYVNHVFLMLTSIFFLLRAPIDNRQLFASEGATLSGIN